MRVLIVVLVIALIFILTGCEQTQAEKDFWDGTERLGKHIAREMLNDD